jgi:hypothetical protein
VQEAPPDIQLRVDEIVMHDCDCPAGPPKLMKPSFSQ